MVCEEGLDGVDGNRWFPALIGFRLDMEWMTKVGTLDRSYQNVGTRNAIPCCHECDAGAEGVHFEDVNTTARWISTCWNTVPWSSSPPWHSVAFDTQAPAKFLRRDAFHIFRMGIGRNFLGSSVLLFVRMGCPLTSSRDKFSGFWFGPLKAHSGNGCQVSMMGKALLWVIVSSVRTDTSFCIASPMRFTSTSSMPLP